MIQPGVISVLLLPPREDLPVLPSRYLCVEDGCRQEELILTAPELMDHAIFHGGHKVYTDMQGMQSPEDLQ